MRFCVKLYFKVITVNSQYCNALLIGSEPFFHTSTSGIVVAYAQPRRIYTGCPSCTESNSSWHWWCSQSTQAGATALAIWQILCRRATVIQHGLVSAQRLALTTLFHGLERNLATKPCLWLAQSYGTVYQQQFVKLTACVRSDASSKHTCLLCVLMTD